MTIEFTKPKRKVTKVFIHCSASDAGGKHYVGKALVDTITGWHLARGFNHIGYHYVIDKQGNTMAGRGLGYTPAAQVGHNTGSIAICVHGLKDFTPISMVALVDLCIQINRAYDGQITFHGHCEVSDKACPVFDYKSVLGLDEKGYMGKKFEPIPVEVDKGSEKGDNKESLSFWEILCNLFKRSER